EASSPSQETGFEKSPMSLPVMGLWRPSCGLKPGQWSPRLSSVEELRRWLWPNCG
ncbi:Hypothetical predicted protein, partial [Marmota monax]